MNFRFSEQIARLFKNGKKTQTADFSVSRVFSDNMVLQRGELIRVWGFADAKENGKKVYGEFKGMSAEATIANGEWCMTFPKALQADATPSRMKIYTDKTEVVFDGVLVGDVYMIIGQSNVEAEMSSHFNLTDPATHGGGEAAIDPNSLVRLNMTTAKLSLDDVFPTRGSKEVCKDYLNEKQWTKTTVEDTLPFSALGYYFAKNMVDKSENKVPVGIIEAGFSGYPLGSFLPNEVAEALKTDTYDPVKKICTTTGRNAREGGGRFIYNRHLYPFERYAIAGMVWYQGESNGDITEAPYYNEKFSALVDHMRSTHNLVNKNFPVFVIELPSIYPMPEGYTGTDNLRWRYIEIGMIRSFMGTLPTLLENTYVCAASDLWGNKEYCNGLHPYIKYEQAARLADIAAAVTLDKGEMSQAAGPVFNSAYMSEDKMSAVITFDNVGDGLKTLDGSDVVMGVVGLNAGSNSLDAVVPKNAKITGSNKITVEFDETVIGVAYNFMDGDFFGETLNLCNSNGNPAIGFCKVTEEEKFAIKSEDAPVDNTDESFWQLD